MAQTILAAAEYYAYAGLAVAAVFLLAGIDRIDPGARNAYAVRPLLFPGVVLLWPLVLVRWLQLERAKATGAGEERS